MGASEGQVQAQLQGQGEGGVRLKLRLRRKVLLSVEPRHRWAAHILHQVVTPLCMHVAHLPQ